jgi:copper oxidase (laccase) domain-containing protein
MQFDLPAFGLARLRGAGIKDAAWTRHCTYADPSRFYSYRRSVHDEDVDYGRLIAAIRL